MRSGEWSNAMVYPMDIAVRTKKIIYMFLATLCLYDRNVQIPAPIAITMDNVIDSISLLVGNHSFSNIPIIKGNIHLTIEEFIDVCICYS